MHFYSQQIRKDVDSFQGNVQKLSGKIQSVSSLWRDEQYTSLMSGISIIAMESRDVIVSGDKLCESIDRFFCIAEIEY